MRKVLLIVALAVALVLAAIANGGAPMLQKSYASGTTDLEVNLTTLCGCTGRGVYVHAVGADLTISTWRADDYIGPIYPLYGDTLTVKAGTDLMLSDIPRFDLIFINRTSATEVLVEVW